jgi:PAS domain S-box-containing protein
MFQTGTVQGRPSLELELISKTRHLISLGAWQWNAGSENIYWTDEMFQMLEIFPVADNLISFTTALSYIHPADRDIFEQSVRGALRHNGGSFTYKCITSSGKLHYLTNNYECVFDRKGNLVCVYGTCQDITKQRTQDENRGQNGIEKDELRDKNEFIEKLVDSSVNCVFVLDKDLRYTIWNKRCEKLYGFKKEVVIGKTVSEVFRDYDVSWFIDGATKALSGKEVTLEQWSSAIAGRFYLINLIPIKDNDDEVSYVFGLVHDYTELKSLNKELQEQKELAEKASEKLKQINLELEEKNSLLKEKTDLLEIILDSTPDVIGVYDKNLNLLTFNKAAAKRLGMVKEEAIGKNVFEIFPAIQGTIQLENLERALNGEMVDDYEFVSIDGIHHYIGSVSPLKDEKGEVFAAITIGHDVTNLHQMMAEKDQLNTKLSFKNSELNRLNTELASFSYVASHDLQEPLRKIQAFISLLLSREANNISDTGKDYFTRINASASRMQEMIDGLLSFSRTNTAAKLFEKKDLNEVIVKALSNLNEEIHKKKAIIESEPLPEAKIITHQFEQLMEHIISNALKFQKQGTNPHIIIHSKKVPGTEIEGEVAERNMDYHQISIKDNGIGFEPENAEKIFELFQRLNGKTEYSGTGIGLSICRRIIQNHNGIITTESEPEKGSVFHIFLPVNVN